MVKLDKVVTSHFYITVPLDSFGSIPLTAYFLNRQCKMHRYNLHSRKYAHEEKRRRIR